MRNEGQMFRSISESRWRRGGKEGRRIMGTKGLKRENKDPNKRCPVLELKTEGPYGDENHIPFCH